jgi:hypothetical protein
MSGLGSEAKVRFFGHLARQLSRDDGETDGLRRFPASRNLGSRGTQVRADGVWLPAGGLVAIAAAAAAGGSGRRRGRQLTWMLRSTFTQVSWPPDSSGR